MDQTMLITFGSALIAAFSFAAFALPFLNRSEKKERFYTIVEKRRKDLFQATRDGSLSRAPQVENISGKETMAGFFKVQKLAGDMGEKIRSNLLQAGVRDPAAPIKYMISQALIPICLCGFIMLIFAGSDKEVSSSVTMLILLACGGFGYKLPSILLKNKVLKRQQEISLAFPDSLDMMLICVQGGIGLEQTVDRVAHEVAEHSPVLAEELGILSAEMAMLNDRRQALQDFARRVGSGGAKSFATALIQAEQYGTSISQAMRVMADELRDQRMSLAEQKAAALPPKLTVPMILFFLPALFVIILGPAGIQAGASGVGG